VYFYKNSFLNYLQKHGNPYAHGEHIASEECSLGRHITVNANVFYFVIKLHNRNSGSYHQSSYHYADFVYVAALFSLLPLLRAKLDSYSRNHAAFEIYNQRNSTFCCLFKEATQNDKLQNFFFMYRISRCFIELKNNNKCIWFQSNTIYCCVWLKTYLLLSLNSR
jgi:hypothetical protein